MSILTEKAVLVALNVGGWNARKRDDEASSVVHEHYHAEKDSGNYNKCLIDVKNEHWVAITRARTALREYHYSHTLPWVLKGSQLLAAAGYLDYNEGVRIRINAYTKAFTAFVEQAYDNLKADAKKKRNGMYREDDYPTKSDLRRKYYAEVAFLPVPDKGHVVVDLQNKEVERIQRDTEMMIAQAVEQAQLELWRRLYDPVAKMAASLNDPTTRFHDTLVSNVRDIVALAPSMNLAEDEKLSALVSEVKKQLTKASPDTLRTDPDVRVEQAKKASVLAKKMSSLMPK